MEDLEEEILNCTDVTRLLQIKIELNHYLASDHNDLAATKDYLAQIKEKGNIRIIYSMIEVLNSRVLDVKEQVKFENIKANRINYNFRMAAKSVLTKATYKKIEELANQLRSTVKEQEAELEKERVEN